MSATTARTANGFISYADFELRVADTRGSRRQSSELVNAMYSWRGYDVEGEHDARLNELTVQVCRDERVIATMTICRDAEDGIPADSLYKAEIDGFRARGARLCELTRLAVDPTHRSKEVLGALFGYAHFHSAICGGVTDALIEVNPRHMLFYKRVMKFRQVGEEKVCARVNAPAVLLHQELAAIGRQIQEAAERHERVAEAPQPCYAALAGARRATPASHAAYAA